LLYRSMRFMTGPLFVLLPVFVEASFSLKLAGPRLGFAVFFCFIFSDFIALPVFCTPYP
jgi:hypothetical protein